MRTYVNAAAVAAVVLGLGASAALASDDTNRANHGPNDDFRVYLNKALDPASSEDPCHAGEVWQGSGAPNTGFARKRNIDAGVELGLKAIMRQGPDLPATYIDGDGFVHFEVPTGAQVGNPGRAAWSWNYSVAVGLNGTQARLGAYDVELWVDVDSSERKNYVKLNLSRVGPATAQTGCSPDPSPDLNGYGWKDKDGNPVIGDDEGTDQVSQNSQNVAFWTSVIDGANPVYTFGPGEFDVILKIKRQKRPDRRRNHDYDTVLHVVFNVVDNPTQTP